MNSEQPSYMNEHHSRNAEPTNAFSPSDEELLEYLLGPVSPAVSQRIEAWLASDASTGDRLAQLSTMLLEIDQAIRVPSLRHENETALASTPSTVHRRRRIALAFAVAASLGFIALSLSRFWQDDVQTQVAMAWVEALPSTTTTDAPYDPSSVTTELDYDFENVVLSDTSSPLDESLLLDMDDEPSVDMDFMTDEPPEWLLAAVSQVHGNDSPRDQSELTP